MTWLYHLGPDLSAACSNASAGEWNEHLFASLIRDPNSANPAILVGVFGLHFMSSNSNDLISEANLTQ